MNLDRTCSTSPAQHTRTRTGLAALIAAGALAAPAAAQLSNVAPLTSYSWSENVGWMDWRDAGSPLASQGVFLGSQFLSGYIWSENVGWISVGGGQPSNGLAYSNATGVDFGVNILADGTLSGLAWGENIGWINFGAGALATPASPARFDDVERRLRGHAWGENIGWINLDDAAHYVGFLCPSDYDQNTFVNGVDFDSFVAAFEAGDQSADFNHDTFVNGVDFDEFIAAFAAGC